MSSLKIITDNSQSGNAFYLTTDEHSIKCRDIELSGDSRFFKLFTRSESLIKESYEESLDAALSSLKQTSKSLKLTRYHNTLDYIKILIDDPNTPDAFHVIDIGRVAERFSLWKDTLTEVLPFYAVKANPDPIIVETLASLGLGFDCASENELKLVLNYGVSPDRIIFSNSRKFNSCINFAKKNGVKKMTFDSYDELIKMKEIYPEAEYIIRIKTEDSDSVVKLSTKFGCTMKKALELIKICNYHKLNLIGVNFHVGSNNSNAASFKEAISNCALLFKEARENYGMNFTFLDIGGGWPGTNDILFKQMAQVVKQSLKLYFNSTVKVIAEPGRFFSAPVVSIVTKIIGIDEFINENFDDSGQKKVEKCYSYFLSNGIYQSFLDSIYYNFDLKLIKSEGLDFIPLAIGKDFDSDNLFSSILFGPSCDCGDKILLDIMLPEMKRGDYLYSYNTGAYFNAMGTNFNGIEQSKPFYFYT